MIIFNKLTKLTQIFTFIILSTLVAFAEPYQKATITTQGSHSVLIKHDQATISGSVKTYNIKADKAVQENAKVIQIIRKNLKKNGFDPQKLYSDNYSLKSNYDYLKNKQVFRDYQVTHDISITTNNLKKIGIIADLMINSGLNQIHNIEFNSSETNKAYEVALKQAVLDAKNKAFIAVSKIKDTTIGKAISIHINPSHHSQPPVLYKHMAESRAMLAGSPPTELQTKGQKITVNVQTIWELISQ